MDLEILKAHPPMELTQNRQLKYSVFSPSPFLTQLWTFVNRILKTLRKPQGWQREDYICPHTNVFLTLIWREAWLEEFYNSVLQIRSGNMIRNGNMPTGLPFIPLVYYSMTWYIVACAVRPFLLPSKVHSQVHCLRFCPLGDFPSPRSFGDVPERGCSVTDAHFLVVLVCHAEPSINQAQVFSPRQWIMGNSPWGHSAGWKWEGSVAGVRAMGNWGPSCNYLCLQGLLEPDHIYFTSIW